MPDKQKKPLILVTNDDGVEAKGMKSLIEVVRPLGKVLSLHLLIRNRVCRMPLQLKSPCA